MSIRIGFTNLINPTNKQTVIQNIIDNEVYGSINYHHKALKIKSDGYLVKIGHILSKYAIFYHGIPFDTKYTPIIR